MFLAVTVLSLTLACNSAHGGRPGAEREQSLNPTAAAKLMDQLVKLAMVGCSHRHSSLAVRERLTFTPTQTADALAAWRTDHAQTEAVLLSTCNRVELYTASAGSGAAISTPKPALHHLADFHNVPIEDVRDEVMRLDDADVVRHLFSVAASLDSMVVGEAQILGQVKQAYELAGRIGSTGPVTHHLFQAAMRVARRVTNETTLHRHRVSIPSVAIADFASRVFERFDDKRVLVIGAGKMAQETLRYLTDVGARHLVILNRDAGASRVARRRMARHARRLEHARQAAGRSRSGHQHDRRRSTDRHAGTIFKNKSRAAAISGRCSFSTWRCRAISIPRSTRNWACICLASTT